MNEPRLTVIQPESGWALPNLRELIAHRDLLRFFVHRDLKVRYRQTALGIGWAVLQPLLTLGVMSLVFGRVLKLSSEGVPYPLFCFAGLVLWQYFAQAVTVAASSVTNNRQLIEKVYLPRLIIPLSAVLSGLTNLGISLTLLMLLMLAYGVVPGIGVIIICLPVALLTALFAATVGSVLAALSVRFRDFTYLVPIGLQLWMFASPVVYASSAVPDEWLPFFALNPMTGLIGAFRSGLLGTPMQPGAILISTGMILFALPVALVIFRRLERNFADVI